jgi:hypothetical protein
MPALHKYTWTKNFLNSKPTFLRTSQKNNSFESSLFSNHKHKKKIETKKINSFFFNKKIKKEIIIEWEKGGKEIYLTGSFCNSHNFFSKKTHFEQKYDFKYNSFKKLKFKSEGKFNIISVLLSKKSFFFNNKNYLMQNKINKTISTKDSFSNFVFESNKKKIDFSFSKKNYCNYYPKQNEMKEIADKKPCHFPTECFHGANQFQKEIGSKKYLLLEKNDVFNSSNDSYKIIDKKDHILLNHLISKKKINSVVIKYRHKNTTFIYYK